MIDTHTHLTMPPLSTDVEGVLARAREAGVTKFVVPGTGMEDSTSGVNLSALHDDVFAAIGVHPVDAQEFSDANRQQLKELLEGVNGVVSIGEVGLDYYHFEGMDEAEIESFKAVQASVFREMVAAAEGYSLPLIVHSRNAFTDTHAVLKNRRAGTGAVIHCFTGTAEEAEGWLDSGCMISLTAIITYKKNVELRETVKNLPLGRIMIETDSPFLPPEGKRGQVCEPMYVREVAACVAEVKGMSLDEVDAVTTANAERFFGI